MKNKKINIFIILFVTSGIIDILLGFLLIYFTLYDKYNLIGTGKILYELIFGSLYVGTYYMQRVPSYIMGIFFIIYGLLSFLSTVLLSKKNNLTRGLGMISCTFGLVAILLSRPIRYEIFYIISIIWLFQLTILILLWNKLLFLEEKNEIQITN
ncbi:MAG: hypothetical protein LN408_03770 [Candidatus Thermoplasmatota archaeon]|nr:hypothetical protein [Candidatus Thermoplasmatota archaeon]